MLLLQGLFKDFLVSVPQHGHIWSRRLYLITQSRNVAFTDFDHIRHSSAHFCRIILRNFSTAQAHCYASILVSGNFDKTFSETMMVSLLRHICVTRPHLPLNEMAIISRHDFLLINYTSTSWLMVIQWRFEQQLHPTWHHNRTVRYFVLFLWMIYCRHCKKKRKENWQCLIKNTYVSNYSARVWNDST